MSVSDFGNRPRFIDGTRIGWTVLWWWTGVERWCESLDFAVRGLIAVRLNWFVWLVPGLWRCHGIGLNWIAVEFGNWHNIVLINWFCSNWHAIDRCWCNPGNRLAFLWNTVQWSRDCEAPWNCIGTDRLPIDSLCRDGLQRNAGSLAICPGNCGTGGLLQYYGGVVEPDRDCKADLDCSSIWELARNWIDQLLLQQLVCIPQILVRFGQSPYNPFAIKTDCEKIQDHSWLALEFVRWAWIAV